MVDMRKLHVGAEVVEVRKLHATNTNEGYYACPCIPCTNRAVMCL